MLGMDSNQKYTFKFVLWDYLKSIASLEIEQIAKLTKLYGYLFARKLLPLHILKVIEFENLQKP